MIAKVQNLYRLLSLATLSDVSPTPRVNTSFAWLRDQVVSFPTFHRQYSARMLQNRMRVLCAKGEFALERSWAKRISESRDPHKELRAFPYYKVFDCLASREWQMVQKRCANAKKLVFLGSGPLPLTAILIAIRFGCSVTLVDNDREAVEISRNFIDALGVKDVRVVHENAEDFQGVTDADVVYVAALVGISPTIQEDIYQHLAGLMKQGSCLLVRSSHASRKMMYRPVQRSIDTYFHRVAELHPHDAVINSTILLQPYA